LFLSQRRNGELSSSLWILVPTHQQSFCQILSPPYRLTDMSSPTPPQCLGHIEAFCSAFNVCRFPTLFLARVALVQYLQGCSDISSTD
jgi:hypothetical protein